VTLEEFQSLTNELDGLPIDQQEQWLENHPEFVEQVQSTIDWAKQFGDLVSFYNQAVMQGIKKAIANER